MTTPSEARSPSPASPQNGPDLRQDQWLERARTVLPAGGFGNFDPGILVREGLGSRVHDENGKEYVDYLIGSGPMLLGHGHPEVLDATREQLGRGLTFFTTNTAGIALAESIVDAVACAEQVRFVTSGGEADMYALRLARAFTGRTKILKFEGGYHGMCGEALMSLAPERLVNFPTAVPDSAGIPDSVRDDVLVAPFNDSDAVIALIEEHGEDIAAIIVEPLQRVVPPVPGFLATLRDECTRRGIVLIFDEIVTGFRLAYGGAQAAYGVVPDLCTLGKIIGGGFPLAAVAGREDILSHFDVGKVGSNGFLMQLGTLSGNPVAAVAGLKTMEVLRRDGSYATLEANGRAVMDLIVEALDPTGLPYRIVGEPALFDVVFAGHDVRDYRSWKAHDGRRNALFERTLREHGLLKSPIKLYPSLALDDRDLELTRRAYRAAAQAISVHAKSPLASA